MDPLTLAPVTSWIEGIAWLGSRAPAMQYTLSNDLSFKLRFSLKECLFSSKAFASQVLTVIQSNVRQSRVYSSSTDLIPCEEFNRLEITSEPRRVVGIKELRRPFTCRFAGWLKLWGPPFCGTSGEGLYSPSYWTGEEFWDDQTIIFLRLYLLGG